MLQYDTKGGISMQQLKDLEVNLYRLLLLKGIHFIPLPKRKEEPLIISIDSLSLEEKHKKAIIKFLDKTTPYFSFKNINETLETLKIDNLSKKKSKRKNASATYCISTNKIKILEKDYEKAIYHELFHAHTSYNTLIHYGSGFSKTSIEYLGDSLDEGYTDLISNRYFESEITEQITANMARKVEMIITEEKMRHLYTNNNLKELINSIAKLSSKLEAQKFILLLDDIDTCKKQKRINHFSILSNYLTDLYLEKFSYIKPQYFQLE